MTGYTVTPGPARRRSTTSRSSTSTTSQVAARAQDRRQGRQARMELLHRPDAAVGPRPRPRSRAERRVATRLRRPARPDRRLGAGPGPGRSTPSTPASCCSPATRSCSRSTTTTTTTPTPDRSTVALQTRPGTAPIKQLDIINPIGPVEIPCMPGATEPAVRPRRRARGRRAPLRPGRRAHRARACCSCAARRRRSSPPTFNDGVARSSLRHARCPTSGTIVGGHRPHAHARQDVPAHARSRTRPTEQVLLDIPTWNFDWQMNYELAEADPRRSRARRSAWSAAGTVRSTRTGRRSTSCSPRAPRTRCASGPTRSSPTNNRALVTPGLDRARAPGCAVVAGFTLAG